MVMARTEHFQAGTLRIEAQRIDNGWHFYAWRPHVSQAFTDGASLLRWAKWPIKTPTGDALRQWLAGLDAALTPEPAAAEPNDQTQTII
jgi:hypothetical protein